MATLIPYILGYIVAKKTVADEPMSTNMLGATIGWLCCSMMIVFGTSKVPVKTPPIFMIMGVWCVCSSCATGVLVKDTQKRIKKSQAPPK